MSQFQFNIIRQAKLIGAQVEELRSAVGWDRMTGKYDLILARSYTHFSVVAGARLVGFVNVISDGVADAFLVDLMVHPDYQRQGIGQALIQRAIEELITEGIRCVEVIFEPGLESFYQACGFHIMKSGIIDSWVTPPPDGGQRDEI